VQTVYHTAAHKHVPLVESNPIEGAANNVLGTLTVAEAAFEAGVGTFVLISTDKAVRPTSVMGATKRWAELIVQDLSVRALERETGQRFCAVRFGNVLGSNGSVVPLFKEQIARGGPVTVTHPEVTRYFMSIHEAVALVIQAGSLSRSGEVFMIDMGEPVRIVDLARRMITLAGLTVRDDHHHPEGALEIRYTGLRPGEKLFEELLIRNGSTAATVHPKIMKAEDPAMPPELLRQHLCRLTELLRTRQQAALGDLLLMVAMWTPRDTNGPESSAERAMEVLA
jgi:FlaA1/EpsC-like NDP-sugar epimerase